VKAPKLKEKNMQHWTEEDREVSENAVETSIQYFRSNPHSNTSVHRRNLRRKIITNELKFLKENFPESYILSLDISDISLELE
jgi:hypothetical protein